MECPWTCHQMSLSLLPICEMGTLLSFPQTWTRTCVRSPLKHGRCLYSWKGDGLVAAPWRIFKIVMKQKNMQVKNQCEKRREEKTSYDSKHGGTLVNGTGSLRVTYSLDIHHGLGCVPGPRDTDDTGDWLVSGSFCWWRWSCRHTEFAFALVISCLSVLCLNKCALLTKELPLVPSVEGHVDRW